MNLELFLARINDKQEQSARECGSLLQQAVTEAKREAKQDATVAVIRQVGAKFASVLKSMPDGKRKDNLEKVTSQIMQEIKRANGVT